MKLVALAALAAISSAASAMETVVFDQYTLTYDETTIFGGWSGAFGSGSNVGFNWNVPTGVSVVSNNAGQVQATFALPSFTVTARPGWALSGPVTGFLGNLTFAEVGDAGTWITFSGNVGVVGGPSAPVSGTLDRTVTSSGPGFTLGYHAGELASPAGPIPSLVVSNASITLNAVASGPLSFAAISGQPQNQLRVSFQVTAVPEPETWAMLAAGLGMIGFMARRRQG